MITDQMLQRVLDERGYLVLSTFDTFRVGEVVNGGQVNRSMDHYSWVAWQGSKLVVIGETTREDMAEQGRLLGFDPMFGSIIPNYYKVIAE